MALDFTVVCSVRQRFGDDKRDERESGREREFGIETGAPFVGLEKEFPFQCPSVDRNQFAILLFQSQGVSRQQDLEINGQAIYGGIPTRIDRDTRVYGYGSEAQQKRDMYASWNGNVMLVHPGVLQEDNVLLIRASEMTAGNIDDFIIDNVVVVFKTTPRGSILNPEPGATAARARTKRSKKPSKRRK